MARDATRATWPSRPCGRPAAENCHPSASRPATRGKRLGLHLGRRQGAPTFNPTRVNVPRRNGRTMAPPCSMRLKKSPTGWSAPWAPRRLHAVGLGALWLDFMMPPPFELLQLPSR